MLGADGDRVAEPQRIGFERPGAAGAPLALIGHEDGGLAGSAHQVGKGPIGPRRAGARINKKEHGIGLRDGRRRLRLHPSGEALAVGIREPGRIDHLKRKVTKPSLAFPPIARDARPIVDEREARAHEAVEQGRFADIGPTDDGDGEGHDAI